MGTVNSGSATKDRARNLAKQIGADHLDVKVDIVIDAMAKLFEVITGRTPRFRVCCCHHCSHIIFALYCIILHCICILYLQSSC